MRPREGSSLFWLLAATLICCGLPVLAATGAIGLAGIAGWLLGGGLFWLAVAALAIGGGDLWWRHMRAGGGRQA